MYLFAALVTASLAISAVTLDAVGRRERWVPPQGPVTVITVDDSGELIAALQASRVRNATLVSCASQLGFSNLVVGDDLPVRAAYPLGSLDYRAQIARRPARANRLWLASELGLFRTIHHVMPPAPFALRVAEGRRAGAGGIAPDGKSVVANNEGYLRRISDRVPSLSERLVLDVDASYFEEETPDALMERLRSADLSYALVFLNRAVDDTTTSHVAQSRLEEFGRLLEAGR